MARLAGVSAQTVSRLIKGFEGIRPGTRERVEAAIAELDYRPNQAARLLRTRKSKRIGALAHEMFEFGPARLLRGAANEARRSGYSVNIVGVDGDDELAIEEAFRSFEEEQVAGIIAVTLTDSMRRVVERRPLDVPIIVDPAETLGGGQTISQTGAAMAADHLLQLGHRRIGYLGGPDGWLPSRERRSQFLADVRAGGGQVVAEWSGDWTPASGDRAGAAFDPSANITAVFVANDAMAIGFIHRLFARGLDVPGDVSVVGFDDIAEAAYMNPPLTTVRPDFEAEGRIAIGALLAEIEHHPRGDFAHPGGELIVRSSTASVR
ncbi:LacI family DNA-binding transcriptional regulator [Streptomyces sp. ISL-90]|nr:LacI family DNA-binding transcriptional regulator [Streptomyces sp. ISL-90]